VTATAGRGHALPLTIEEHSALLQGSPFGLDATQMPCISGRGADFGSLLIVVGDEQDLPCCYGSSAVWLQSLVLCL